MEEKKCKEGIDPWRANKTKILLNALGKENLELAATKYVL